MTDSRKISRRSFTLIAGAGLTGLLRALRKIPIAVVLLVLSHSTWAFLPQDIAGGASSLLGQDIMGGAAVVFRRPPRIRAASAGLILKRRAPQLAANVEPVTNTDKADALNTQGNTYYDVGQFAQAVADWDRAIELDDGSHKNEWLAKRAEAEAKTKK